MKNIEAILKEAGLEVTEEQLAVIKPAVQENYKPIADYNKQKEKVSDLEETLKATKESLAAFEGVDLDGIKKQVEALEQTIADRDADLRKKDEEYAQQIADRDFMDTIEKAITAKGGLNQTAIKSLLKMEELKGSKNQKEDIEKALDELVEAADSAMLFGASEVQVGSGNPIGTVKKTQQAEQTTMAAALSDYYAKK